MHSLFALILREPSLVKVLLNNGREINIINLNYILKLGLKV